MVRICRKCDRGQRYCGKVCARASRREQVRESGRRYRRTTKGTVLAAQRQKRYRLQRSGEKTTVTHQGSAPPRQREKRSSAASTVLTQRRLVERFLRPDREQVPERCCFCGTCGGPRFRYVFLALSRSTE